MTGEIRDDQIENSYIYVLPTERGLPPMAILGKPGGDLTTGTPIMWSADTGWWMHDGHHVPPELNQIITEHARDLGVPGF